MTAHMTYRSLQLQFLLAQVCDYFFYKRSARGRDLWNLTLANQAPTHRCTSSTSNISNRA
jgi:hypothetical protein